MSATFAYQYQFTGDYDESIFLQGPDTSSELRVLVQDATERAKRFLVRYTTIRSISQQVTYLGNLYKVILTRAA